jgi:deoxyribose-phosphate aldolase
MKNLNKYIEHTLLKQDATEKELTKLFEEALKYDFLGVCINPSKVKFAKEYLKNSNTKIVTVVGFPLGANRTEVKAYEARLAIDDGADEIDMVINVGLIKDQKFEAVQKDIETVKKICGKKILKVILETDLLNKEEIEIACKLCINAKADFVKTSTGFVKNGAGAKKEDIELMYKLVSPHNLQVKASGGIRDKQKALDMIKTGVSRLGTSSGVEIMQE